VLTPIGHALLSRARGMVQDLQSLERLARSLKQGWEPVLTLVVDASFPRKRLLDIVNELQQLCPNTQMQLSDAILSGAEDAIVDGSADVVVTNLIPPGFLGEWLMDVRFIAVAAPTHPLVRADAQITTKDLVPHVQCVVRDSGTRSPRQDGWLGATTRCTVSNVDASLSLVQAGLAYAWLPEHLVEEPLRQGSLRVLPLVTGRTRNLPLSLVLVRPDCAGPAARAALECFRRHAPIRRMGTNGDT
jgi:DNA-binding transcriptional LysR family regulator